MKSKNIIFLFALLGLMACGNDGGSSSRGRESGSGNAGTSGEVVDHNASTSNSNSTTATPEEMTQAIPGTYYTVLRPVNFYANGFIPYGAATFTLKNDQLQVDMSMDDDQKVPHRQSLHLGTRCPTAGDDTNGDGLVDYNEALAVVGSVVMPLDGDLNSQVAGAELYPKGPAMTYSKLASLSKINADLWIVDEDTSDNVTKLKPGKSIMFEGRTILVHGTTPQNTFPTSLASYKSEPAHLSLPVVCGVLKKID